MNKIEQLEIDIQQLQGVLLQATSTPSKIDDTVNRIKRLIGYAELSLEIAKGEKHVHTMEQLQTMIISGIAGFLEKQAAEFRIAEKNRAIPTPKDK
tara:strand:- start:1046 stop:1333 length:288 start_codon:yes stop_codon:yes gene_type:complete